MKVLLFGILFNKNYLYVYNYIHERNYEGRNILLILSNIRNFRL